MRRFRRWLLGAVLLLLAVVIAAGIWLLVDRRLGKQAWDQYRAEAIARGVKLTFAEFQPPIVPAEENYTTGTLFELPAASVNVGETPPRPYNLPLPKTAIAISLEESLEQTKAAMIEAGWLDANQAALDAGHAVLLGLERFKTELGELRAARPRPRSRFPQSELPPPKTEFPHLTHAIDVAALWSKRMEALLATGQSTVALEDLRDGLRLYEALTAEPTMISGLVRQALLHAALQAIDLGLAAQRWGAADLPQIQTLLAKIDLAADARHAFESERGFINDSSAAMRALPLREQVERVEAMEFLEELPRGWRLWLKLCSGDGWRRLAQENRILDHRVAQFQTGFDGMLESVPSVDPESKTSLTRMTDMIAKRYVVSEMKRRQSNVVCGLERHHLEFGRYPAILAELVPRFIETVPNDVIDGQPVRYRSLEAGRFLLYSIGANARDDEGSRAIDRNIRGPFKALDWTWNENWK